MKRFLALCLCYLLALPLAYAGGDSPVGFPLNGGPVIGGTASQILATDSSTNLTSIAVTGSGSVVRATSPTLVTPVLGAATATSINGLTVTSSTGIFTLTNAKTLSVNNTLTFAGTDSTTMTFPASSATLAGLGIAQTFTAQNTFAAGTITTSQPLTLTQTWNAGGVTFNALLVNATSTASAAGSLLADFQLAGTSKFAVRSDGTILSAPTAGTGPGSATEYYIRNASNAGIGSATGGTGASVLMLFSNGVRSVGVSDLSLSLQLNSTYSLGWGSATPSFSGPDLTLYRDAANALALRNGANAQQANVYNTWTSTTSYERLAFDWITSANVAAIDVQKGSGGGTQRALSLRINGTEIVGLTTAGVLKLTANNSTGAGSALLGANSPASTLTAPYTWVTVITNDGSTGYVPVWK